VPEPPWQLKSFAKIALAPAQAAQVSIALYARSFSYWSDSANGWKVAARVRRDRRRARRPRACRSVR
jgi:hypothetical protein